MKRRNQRAFSQLFLIVIGLILVVVLVSVSSEALFKKLPVAGLISSLPDLSGLTKTSPARTSGNPTPTASPGSIGANPEKTATATDITKLSVTGIRGHNDLVKIIGDLDTTDLDTIDGSLKLIDQDPNSN